QPHHPRRPLLRGDRPGRLRAAEAVPGSARPRARRRQADELDPPHAAPGRARPLRAAVLMPTILGISAYYHDSAASLVRDGEIVAAAQEERFTRKKHDAGFPSHAVEYCLREAGIGAAELDYVGFYDKPLLKFERLLENYCGVAPKGLRSFLTAMPVWMKE